MSLICKKKKKKKHTHTHTTNCLWNKEFSLLWPMCTHEHQLKCVIHQPLLHVVFCSEHVHLQDHYLLLEFMSSVQSLHAFLSLHKTTCHNAVTERIVIHSDGTRRFALDLVLVAQIRDVVLGYWIFWSKVHSSYGDDSDTFWSEFCLSRSLQYLSNYHHKIQQIGEVGSYTLWTGELGFALLPENFYHCYIWIIFGNDAIWSMPRSR